jgi:hypothetical protein
MQLDVLATDNRMKPAVVALSAFHKDIEDYVAVTFANALAGALKYKSETGCVAWVNEGGCIWTEGHPEEQTYCAESTAPEALG